MWNPKYDSNLCAVALEEKRAKVQNKIIQGLPYLGMPMCSMGCDNTDTGYLSELAEAFDCPFWPPQLHNQMSIKRALEVLHDMDYLAREEDTCGCTDEPRGGCFSCRLHGLCV